MADTVKRRRAMLSKRYFTRRGEGMNYRLTGLDAQDAGISSLRGSTTNNNIL